LEEVLHAPGVIAQEKLLFCLALEPVGPRTVKDIRKIAVDAGWRGARTVNVSEYLGRAKGFAIRSPTGWKLTTGGKQHVANTAKLPQVAAQTAATVRLRKHLASIKSDSTRAFAEEAIKCLEYELKRSAVVSAWVAAVGVLYDHVLAKKLAAFNTAGTARYQAKWKPVTTLDDLADLKEAVFLELCESASVFGKSVKQELEGCLKLRNGCGHPNSLQIGEGRVVTHIEQLILNVFEKF
jgi:hypothetical protein